MKTEFIPKIVTLLAGAVVSLVCIVGDYDVTYSLEVLLATLVIFFIVGIIAEKVVDRVKESNRVMKEKMENMANLRMGEEDMDEFDITSDVMENDNV